MTETPHGSGESQIDGDVAVDGNDVIAVRAVVEGALARARAGEGPTLIEALTYRLSDHTTADDASRYREEEEVAKWEERDPITRFRTYLEGRGLWDEEMEHAHLEWTREWVDAQVSALESMPPQDPSDLFTHMYESLPPHLAEQMAEVIEEVGS